jgi:hypothetical protein
MDHAAFGELISRSKLFVLVTHVNPGCDAISSQVGLGRFLSSLGLEVRVVNQDPTPRELRFLTFDGPEAESYDADRHDGLLDAADAIVLGWGTGTDPDQYAIWHSSQSGPEQLNSISYANPEVDALIEKGRASCHQKERVATYHRIQEILAEDQPLIFLYFNDSLPAVTSRVRGIVPAPSGISYNFIDWFVPKALQRYTSG